MCYTNFEEFKKESKGYNMFPLILEVEGDVSTPVAIFKKLCREKNSYLLESVEDGSKKGRYSYIGRKPFMEIKGYRHKVMVSIGEQEIEEDGIALDIVKRYMENYKVPMIKEMPGFVGGAVGYVGYDAIRDYEDLPNESEDCINMPEIHLLFTEEVVVYDHLKEKIKIIVNVPVGTGLELVYKRGIERLKEIHNEIVCQEYVERTQEKRNLGEFQYLGNETKESFMEKVCEIKNYIREGDVYQTVLSQRFTVKNAVEPFKAYRTLRRLNPSPYMFYINFGEYEVVGSSPELLIKLEGEELETCPIAGTRSRGKNEEEDKNLSYELLNDEKERAEHLMLVDLARNDIGRIANFGSVEVTTFMEVKKYSHVMHIVSNVVGKIREHEDAFSALSSAMPAGTVSGSPKIRAMEIINSLENTKRGLYAGAVGYFGFHGNMDMCIAIRTMIFKDGNAYIQAGAGIVADSDPESEYFETLKKAQALLETLKLAQEEEAI